MKRDFPHHYVTYDIVLPDFLRSTHSNFLRILLFFLRTQCVYKGRIDGEQKVPSQYYNATQHFSSLAAERERYMRICSSVFTYFVMKQGTNTFITEIMAKTFSTFLRSRL